MRFFPGLLLLFLVDGGWTEALDVQKTPPPFLPPIVLQNIAEAKAVCLEFSPSFEVESAVEHLTFSQHPFEYIVLHEYLYACPGCLTCFHPSQGKSYKVFVKMEKEWKLGLSVIALDLKLSPSNRRDIPLDIEMREKSYPGPASERQIYQWSKIKEAWVQK